MPTIKLKNTNLFYEKYGKGEPVIFIHGWSMSSSFWRNQLNKLSKDFRVIAFDLRGHGNSGKEAKEHTIKSFAEDLEEFIGKIGLKNIHLVGWSMGVSVIFEYLSLFGDKNIKSISLVDGNPKIVASGDYKLGTPKYLFERMLKQLQSSHKDFVKGFVPLMFKKEVNKERISSMQNEILKTPLNAAFESLKNLGKLDYRKLLPEIKLPSLIIHGRFDRLNSYTAGHYMLNNILDSRLASFEESSHCPHIEESTRFNNILLNFFREI